MSDAAGSPVVDRTPLAPDTPHRTLGAIRQLVDGGLVAWVMRALGRPSSREDVSLSGIAWAAIVVGIVVLGAWGFLALHHSPRLNAAESVYDAAKLYTIDLGPASGNPGPNWQIWTAFVAAALLVLRGVGALVRGQARRFATSRMLKRHVIVCGAGVHGSELARSLSGRHDVVVLDTDPVSPGMQGKHGRYEWRLIGDAVSPRTLLQAGIPRAHRVIAVTGDDVVNSEIVSTVRGLARDGQALDRVDVQVQVEDPSLSRFLEEEIERDEPATPRGARPVVNPFSANAIAAEQLLARAQTHDERGQPVGLAERIAADRPSSLLLAGDHPLIDLLVLNVLRRRRAASVERLESGQPPPSTAVRISIYGPAAEDRVLRLKERWRPEPQLLLLDGRDSPPPADGGAELDEWLRMPGRGDHAIVACVDQLEGIVLTLGVARAIFGRRSLGVRADLTWRIRPVELPLLQALLGLDPPVAQSHLRQLPGSQPLAPEPPPPSPRVPLSALLRAGLRVTLEPPENLLIAARRLTAAGDPAAFAARCEYVRRSPADDPSRRPPTGDPTIARLLALADGARRAKAIRDDGPAAGVLARARHITIFAGAAGSMPVATGEALAALLTRALHGYDGALLSGGTDVGMPGLVASVADSNRLSALVGYVPARQPASALYPQIHRTEGATEFSIREPLRMWEDILRAGRRPAEVTLLACPGGAITWQEIALARALGARIGWLDPADQSTVALDDRLLLGAGGVVPLPPDAMTIRAFLMPSTLDDDLRETIARSLHEDYRRHQLARKPAGDLSLARWKELPESLRASNLALAADIPNKLALVGMRLTRPEEPGGPLTLTDDQVLMLAEVEHGRYNAERLQAGWRRGPRRVGRATSPYLVPCSELPPEIRIYDVETVSNIAAALAGAGCAVTRV